MGRKNPQQEMNSRNFLTSLGVFSLNNFDTNTYNMRKCLVNHYLIILLKFHKTQ